MKIVLLNGMKKGDSASDAAKKSLAEIDRNLTSFDIDGMNIQPCRSCGACGHVTPGKCVINDDMQDVLRGMGRSDVLVILTPVRFGGYASVLKQAVDRFMPLGLPLYMVKGGHMLHPMRYKKQFFLGIGMMDQPDKAQEENFRELVSHNALNFQTKYRALTFLNGTTGTIIENEIAKALKGG